MNVESITVLPAGETSSNPGIQLEFRVKKVERFIVTRYTKPNPDVAGVVEERGEYDNPEVAHEVAYALCKREHEILGWPIADERIRYPEKRGEHVVIT